MLQRLATLLLAGALLAVPAVAQGTCSTLSIQTETAPELTRQKVTIAVTGTVPEAPVYLVVGRVAGSTSINLQPLGTLDLGLARPFNVNPLGVSDPNGDLKRVYRIPKDIGLSLYAQSVSVQIAPKRNGPKDAFCTSNVVAFGL